MSIKTKTFRLIIIYFVASLLTLGGYVYTEHLSNQKYEREVSHNYNHAFSELSVSMDKISNSMYKVRYATSPSMVVSLCAEVHSECYAASATLGSLPYSNIELEHTAAFISKVGDYAFYLMKKAALGNQRTNEESVNLDYFANGAKQISNDLSKLQGSILSGEIPENSFIKEQEANNQENSGIENSMPISSTFQYFEDTFSEIPSINYDGSYSESANNTEAKFLNDKNQIAEDHALEMASKYSDVDKRSFNVEYTVEKPIPLYVVAGESNGNILSFEITKQGGCVLTYNNNRTVSETSLNVDDALSVSSNYLEQHGFYNMQVIRWEIAENEIAASYAYVENNVVCYPDLIKVSIALDNGEIIGFDASDYIFNHTKRTISAPVITEEQAMQVISNNLNIESVTEAIISTVGKNEIHCYEFKCTDAENGTLLVYVNANTGADEKILILIDSKTGSFTV